MQRRHRSWLLLVAGLLSAATVQAHDCTPVDEVQNVLVDRVAGGDVQICWDPGSDSCVSAFTILGADSPECCGNFDVMLEDVAPGGCLTLAPASVDPYLLVVGYGEDEANHGPTGHYYTQSEAGSFSPQKADEASGLAQSRREPLVVWTHNDDADDNRVFAFRTDGTELGDYDLIASVQDPEDIAIGAGPIVGEQYIYLGDIGGTGGNNHRIWGCVDESSECDNCEGGEICDQRPLAVYRAVEPVVSPDQSPQSVSGIPTELLQFTFPSSMNGEYQNVESLMIDPVTQDLYFVTKETDPTLVFRAVHPYGTGAELVQVAALPGISTVTGGDISSDGSYIAIRNYFSVHVWERPPGTNLWDAFGSPPCIITGIDEHKGEAVALDVDDSGNFYTTTEQSHAPNQDPISLLFFQRY